MGRRIAAAAAILLAATLGGDVSGQARPLTPTKLPILLRVPEPFVHAASRPRRVAAGTLVALVKPGRVVDVRSAPGGPVVARLGARTEFGSPRTFAVTRSGHGLRVITTELPNGSRGWVDGQGALRLSRTTVTLDVDLSTRVLRVRAGSRLLRTMRVGIGAPGTSTPDRPLRDHRQAQRLGLLLGLRLLHPRALGSPDEPPARVDRRRPPSDPRRLDRRCSQHRLPPCRRGRPALADALGPARCADHDPPVAELARGPRAWDAPEQLEMHDWLIGFTVASSGPTWTEIAQAVAAVFAAIGVVGALLFSAYQVFKGRKEQEKGVQLQTAQRALRLMELLIQITTVMVERPYLAPYIYDGETPPDKGEDRHDEVLAYGRLFMSFGEAVGWQIRAHQMDSEAADAWRDYFTDLHENSPTVRCAVKEQESLLAQETRDLFGVEPSSGRRRP